MTTPVNHTANARVAAPFAKSDLTAFLAVIPDDAEIKVITFEGGSQRDPYPTAYGFSATWSIDA